MMVARDQQCCWPKPLLLGFLVPLLLLVGLDQPSGAEAAGQATVVEPKLVCYYTNWAKDRPDPWAYVSSSSPLV